MSPASLKNTVIKQGTAKAAEYLERTAPTIKKGPRGQPVPYGWKATAAKVIKRLIEAK